MRFYGSLIKQIQRNSKYFRGGVRTFLRCGRAFPESGSRGSIERPALHASVRVYYPFFDPTPKLDAAECPVQ